MKKPIEKTNHLLSDVLWISGFISIFFILSICFVNKTDYRNLGGFHSWLTGSTIVFTNNWLSDGIVSDKFTMLEAPLSIETQTIESRSPYVSYPNGTIMVTYGVAKIIGTEQIDVAFVKILNTIFYGLDALLLGIIIYLILTFILKIETGKGKIFISILLSSLWIFIPNNGFYLKNVFFSDQLILFFTFLLLLFEILKNYSGIKDSLAKTIINIFLFLTVFCGVLIDYYFWIQVFILCLINFIFTFRQTKSFIRSLKNILIYIIPSLLAVGLFIFQLTQVNDSWIALKNIFLYRTGQTDSALFGDSFFLSLAGFLYNITFLKIYSVFGVTGTIFLFVSTLIPLLLLWRIISVEKKANQNTGYLSNVLKISLFIILPAFIQLYGLLNHSAVHEFSVLKMNLLLVYGLLLFTFAVFIKKKKSLDLIIEKTLKIGKLYKKIAINGYIAMVAIIVGILISCNFYVDRSGIYPYYKIVNGYYKIRAGEFTLYEMENLVRDYNSFENVFFSFTDSIQPRPPQPLAISKKMVHKIAKPDDIKTLFPNLDKNAGLMFIINKNFPEKSDEVLTGEQYIMENCKFIESRNGYEIYSFY